MKTPTQELPMLLQRFFCVYLPEQRGASPKTISSYRDAMRLYLVFLSRRTGRPAERLVLDDITAPALIAWLAEGERMRKNRTTTRNHRLSAVRCFLRYCAREVPERLQWLQACLGVPMKRGVTPELDYPDHDEMAALMSAPTTEHWSGRRDRVLLATMYNTGARVSEIANAKRSDLALGSPSTILLHGKGRKERRLPLWRKTTALLRMWLKEIPHDPESPLFPNRWGNRLTRFGIGKRLSRAAEQARMTCRSLKSKKVTPHSVRHATAMHLLQKGVDISVIALWFGHNSVDTTHRYMTADLSMKERALRQAGEVSTGKYRYKAPDRLLAILDSL